jgi:hypothetical protein
MAPRFCIACGRNLAENARFCEACGTAVGGTVAPPPAYQPPPVYQPPPTYQPPPQPAYQPPPVYQPSPQAYQTSQPAYAPPPVYPPGYAYPPQAQGIPGEALIGVIPAASRKKSLFSMESFNIVVTNQRMVFAQMTNDMIKAEAAAHRGQGIGGVFKAMTSGYSLWQRYPQMSPDQALAETPGNFGVYLNQIRKVKYSGTKVLFSKGGLAVGMNIGFGVGGNDDDKPAKLEIETIGGKYEFDIILQFQQQAHQVLKAAGLVK